ncbi:MAG: hypothetical protein JHD25_09560 [Sphingomonadaceae bacterium]|jgi:divalent metal cation (Fe/Co/Zn/Cd) transporter|nr:hypothetical protein [Sphingomonadaceae bacterium]MBJ7389251.1 hypothetical protein [Sphingomonadaceae bacterium]
MFEGHSDALVLLLAGCAVLVGVHGYLHARRYWEGLPPLLDAFVSMAGFLGIIGAFVWAGRIGMIYGYPNAARVMGVAIALIIFRVIRTWLGKEQVRYRSGNVQKTETANEL